jgi:hypothetical protein
MKSTPLKVDGSFEDYKELIKYVKENTLGDVLLLWSDNFELLVNADRFLNNKNGKRKI